MKEGRRTVADLPIFERLKSRIGADDSENFFAEFENRLNCPDSPTFQVYQRIDEWLSFVPPDQWKSFLKKARGCVSACGRKRYRYWEKFLDILHEAYGFKLLYTRYGCSTVRYIHGRGLPDFLGESADGNILLEVKSINYSEEECRSFYETVKRGGYFSIPTRIKDKIRSRYGSAIKQLKNGLEHYSATKTLVLMPIHVDHNIAEFPNSHEENFLAFLEEVELDDYPIDFYLITV